jgi:hypothetical protein
MLPTSMRVRTARRQRKQRPQPIATWRRSSLTVNAQRKR